jgi:tRNA-specific 2-thiouridylase
MEHARKKVLVGMSGGVDSSVSAALLLEAGYEVVGAFMKNWSGDVHGSERKKADRVGSEYQECGWKQERRDAARVAAKLGIPFLTFDFEEQYRRDVVDEMFDEFQAGRTPNPDVLCNKFIKFDRFVKAADELGCEFVATGHYARLSCHFERALNLSKGERRICAEIASPGFAELAMTGSALFRAIDQNKDQTYFLWAINPNVLPRILFPIGHLTKPQVRKKARDLGLDVADKKDSTGICFVGEVAMRDFLGVKLPDDPGEIVTVDGAVVGRHPGINFFTIGQRHGLSVGGGAPYYVVEKRAEKKQLIVSSNFHPALFQKILTAKKLNFFRDCGKFSTPLLCQARIRHRQPLQDCTLTIQDDTAHVEFDEPQRAVTPGQSIVFYQNEIVLGGGIIE